MPYVQSSAFERVTYDEESHTLCATFRESHRTFVYEEVPQEVYDGLIFSDSLGRYSMPISAATSPIGRSQAAVIRSLG